MHAGAVMQIAVLLKLLLHPLRDTAIQGWAACDNSVKLSPRPAGEPVAGHHPSPVGMPPPLTVAYIVCMDDVV